MSTFNIWSFTQAMKRAHTAGEQHALDECHREELARVSWDDMMRAGYPEALLTIAGASTKFEGRGPVSSTKLQNESANNNLFLLAII